MQPKASERNSRKLGASGSHDKSHLRKRGILLRTTILGQPPQDIVHSGFLSVRVVTATFRPKSARALLHRESQRVERAGFGLRHGRLRARHSAYTPLPKRGIALSFSIVKSFKQFRALPNWFVLNRLCGCSASRARLGTKAHFGDGLHVRARRSSHERTIGSAACRVRVRRVGRWRGGRRSLSALAPSGAVQLFHAL